MSPRDTYSPGPAAGARVAKKEGDQWTLVVVRELRHPPEKVWEAITDPTHLREWAPFDASNNLGSEGNEVRLTTVGAPQLMVTDTTVTRAERPRELVYNWGGNDMRWQLEPMDGGTRLTLWTSIDRRYIAMGAAGWHLCFDVLDHLLRGTPLGRMVGMEVMKFEGWQRLTSEYRKQFATEDQ
jgi:uncharacterized protein YndB with AHSA1/START domain